MTDGEDQLNDGKAYDNDDNKVIVIRPATVDMINYADGFCTKP